MFKGTAYLDTIVDACMRLEFNVFSLFLLN